MPKDWCNQEDDDFLNSIELESIVRQSMENIRDNSNSTFGTEASSNSTSPDRLNVAILEPKPSPEINSKRKSIDRTPRNTKKNVNKSHGQTLNEMPMEWYPNISKTQQESFFPGTQFFQTQFFRQVDQELMQQNAIEGMQLSQFFSQKNSCLNQSQRFIDDDGEDWESEDQFNIAQSSQAFLEEIRNNLRNQQQTSQIQMTDLPCTVYKSKNASAYIELQRCMLAQNEDNLNEDNYIDPELIEAYQSTQYRREIQADFEECEKSICNISNLESFELNDRIESSNTSIDGQDEMNTAIENMDWNESFLNTPVKVSKINLKKTPLITPTSIIRQRIANANVSAPKTPESSPVGTIISANFSTMGSFFDLPTKVQKLIKDFKGINQLYDWQKECLTLPAISRRHNLIYALPTSGGKTLVAEIIILREVICRQKNCIFILPYVSIVQEKIWALSPFAVQLDFLLEEYAAGKGSLPPRKRRRKRSVYVATIEKALALVDSLIEMDRANEIGLVVVDELHIIGEPGRGVALETLLTKIQFINAGIQIVGMSATIGNLNEIAKFLNADIYTRNFRPVELKEYIKCGKDILEINSQSSSIEDAFNFIRTVTSEGDEKSRQLDPDQLTELVMEIIPENSCLIFCPTKKNCENVAVLLAGILSRKYAEHKQDKRTTLCNAIQSDVGTLCNILAKTIPYGIAYHHSGLTSDERRHLEDAFRQNILCVICCTSTLAAGVNLPAKRVILRSPYVGRNFITLSKYKQMVGRAGRAGMETAGESILICQPRDNVNVANLLCSPMDEAASSLHLDECKGIRNLILSAIGLKLAVCRQELHLLVSRTLLAIQENRLNVDAKEMVDQTIQQLFKLKALSAVCDNKEKNKLSTSTVEFESQIEMVPAPEVGRKKIKNVVITSSTNLDISTLGKAAFKSCIDLKKALVIYKDLEKAQQSLVLVDYLHLLYIITPYEPAEINLTPDMSVYYTQFTKLTPSQLKTAYILGISESCAMKMLTGKAIAKPELARIVNRFFFTLMLHELWQLKPIHEVADIFHVHRGIVQQLISATASYSSSVLKFCEELDEFWAFHELLKVLTKRISYCCTVELIPLMELPCVKLARAKQLYAAGYKRLEEIARATPRELVNSIEHLTHRVAVQLISAAKILLLERVETLREEVQDCLDVIDRKI